MTDDYRTPEEQVLDALREARPYVTTAIAYGQAEPDWRSQKAREILDRVDAAIARAEDES